VPQNPVLDDWVKQGINLIGSVESIQSYLVSVSKRAIMCQWTWGNKFPKEAILILSALK
jgi:hypothetical protein